MAESGSHLTTSRVNRLLRPLRNKCNSLAALSGTSVASRVAHSKQPAGWDSDSRPPLAVLSSLAGTRKLMLDTRSASDFELSRRIHAVCDAFKNIAHVAFGQSCTEPIPSLATMCTLVLGESIPLENSLGDINDDSTNDILDVDRIYEIVPPHCRRFLITSHALSTILFICIHHHTLVTVLLEHCLSFGLVHESTHLLNIILAQAFLTSDPSCPPPATHPGHTNYLLDLHTKWTTGNSSSMLSPDVSLFTTLSFCRVLLDVLSRIPSSSSHTIWTSKVLHRLLHTVVEICDIDSYIFIIGALSRSLSDGVHEIANQSSPGTAGALPHIMRNNTRLDMLRDKLSELMTNLFNLLFAHHDPRSSTLELPRIYAVIDILYNCHAARLHRSRTTTPGPSVDLPDMIIVLTTHIFAAFRNSVDDFDCLLAILDESDPVPTTFSRLMIYIDRSQGGQVFSNFIEAFLSELKLYSSAFCSEKLFRLNASLWACALHHFETSIAISQKGCSALVTRYKQQLMQAVDIAERRCFGGCMIDTPDISLIRSARPGRIHRARTSGQWEWEDMVGSWIRRTPVHKKRKIDNGLPPRHGHSRPRSTDGVSSKSVSAPLLACHRRPSVFSLSSSDSRSSGPESCTEDGSEYQDETDKENHPRNSRRGVEGSRRAKCRSSNFFSLLADAQINHIVLHPKPRPKRRSLSFVIPEKHVLPTSSQKSRNPPRKESKTYPKKTSASPVLSGTVFFSDDSLNLFAYATSSPTRS